LNVEKGKLNQLNQALLNEKSQIELLFTKEKRTNEDVAVELETKITMYK
jgi:hypothetical protein